MGVFFRELSSLYHAFISGDGSPLPELAIQYADFSVWQRDWLQDEILDSQLGYWMGQLENYPTLDLPTDKPRPPLQTFNGASQIFIIPSAMVSKLDDLSIKKNATLFMTLIAAFNLLLSRYSGQVDICLGIPIANRNRSEIEDIIGFFANTLVLRTDLSGNPTFLELLSKVRETSISAYANQDLPFEKLVEEINPPRDLSRNPLFQVLFVMQNAPIKPLQLYGLKSEKLIFKSETTHFDLELSMSKEGDELQGKFKYNTDLFEDATIARMTGHFLVLLNGIINYPALPISKLPLLTSNELDRTLREWNNTSDETPQFGFIHRLFELQAVKTPDAKAAIYPVEGANKSQYLTYRELNIKANQLANYLIEQGIGPDEVVGIYVARSLEMVIGVLGTIKAGGVYVPLDPAYPKDRLAFMLSETETSVILTQEKYLNDLPENNAQVICVDRDWSEIQQAGDQNPDICISAENLVYVLYTSGSTGIPKGVAMRHGAMVNLIEYEIQKSNIGPGANILQFNSLSFDVSFNEIFWALSTGGMLVIIPDEIRSDIEKLAEFICDQKISHMILPFIGLLQIASVYDQNKSYPKGLREVISTAEQLYITSGVRQLFLQIPNCTLQNHYGPTETHVVTALQMGSSPCDWPERPSIGKPIDHTQSFILDQHLQPVPIGVTGELYIGGAGLARGYFNRPAITAESFIPNPFAKEPGGRLYKTGDLVRFHMDGSIEFLGRADHQVKIRGYRIELGEIEAILNKADGVQETAVIAQGDSLGDEKLVAYIVAKFQHKLPVGDLRAHIKRSLPDYMVPSQFVFLEALPLTPSGKIDRRSLPAPDQTRPELESPYAAPESVIEEALAGLFADVLGIEQVGVNDNFFELGGHSLLATMVISRLRYVFKLDISLITFFQGPTIAELSNALLAQETNPGEIYEISSYIISSQNSSILTRPNLNKLNMSMNPKSFADLTPEQRALLEQRLMDGQSIVDKLSNITKRRKSENIPLSYSQWRLWFLDQFEPGSPTYNLSAIHRLLGSINTDVLEQAINEIIRRHDALRTIFSIVEDEPVQVIQNSLKIPLQIIEINHHDKDERENQTRELVRSDLQEPFYLSSGPLIRAKLYRLETKDHVLLINTHHIISDAWSLGLFFKELDAIYDAFLRGEPSPLADIDIQYADYAIWQRNILDGDTLDKHLSYWKEQLADAPRFWKSQPITPGQGFEKLRGNGNPWN